MLLADTEFLQTIKEPGFATWVVYAIAAGWVWEKVTTYLERKKAKDVNIQQPLSIQMASQPADRQEVEKLNKQLADLDHKWTTLFNDHAETDEARHRERALAGEHRVENLSRVVDAGVARIEARLDKDAHDNQRGRSELHEKINAVSATAISTAAQLPHLQTAITHLETRLSNDIKGVHQRCDDAIRLAADKRNKS